MLDLEYDPSSIQTLTINLIMLGILLISITRLIGYRVLFHVTCTVRKNKFIDAGGGCYYKCNRVFSQYKCYNFIELGNMSPDEFTNVLIKVKMYQDKQAEQVHETYDYSRLLK